MPNMTMAQIDIIIIIIMVKMQMITSNSTTSGQTHLGGQVEGLRLALRVDHGGEIGSTC